MTCKCVKNQPQCQDSKKKTWQTNHPANTHLAKLKWYSGSAEIPVPEGDLQKLVRPTADLFLSLVCSSKKKKKILKGFEIDGFMGK